MSILNIIIIGLITSYFLFNFFIWYDFIKTDWEGDWAGLFVGFVYIMTLGLPVILFYRFDRWFKEQINKES